MPLIFNYLMKYNGKIRNLYYSHLNILVTQPPEMKN